MAFSSKSPSSIVLIKQWMGWVEVWKFLWLSLSTSEHALKFCWFLFFNFVLQCLLCDVNGAFCHGSKMWVSTVKRFGFWLNFGQYILCYPWACLSFYFDFRFHFLDAMHVMLNRECLVQGITIISMIRNREYVGCLFIIC